MESAEVCDQKARFPCTSGKAVTEILEMDGYDGSARSRLTGKTEVHGAVTEKPEVLDTPVLHPGERQAIHFATACCEQGVSSGT